MRDIEAAWNAELADAVRARANAAPGFVPLLGLSIEEFAPGTVRCRLTFRADLLNGVGVVHGGALAALVDHTLSLAVYPLVAAGAWVATTDMSVQYLAPVHEGDCVATGTVTHLGRRHAVVRVDVTNAGRVVAAALGRVSVLERPAER
jgi:uncharacterized protein (TIGR00369 family)